MNPIALLQKTLDEILASRPVQPGPVAQMDPAVYREWSAALSVWAWKKDEAEKMLESSRNPAVEAVRRHQPRAKKLEPRPWDPGTYRSDKLRGVV